jgi:hypothetical protein
MSPKIRTSWLLAAGLGLAACSEGTDGRDAAQRSPGEVGRVIVADRDRTEAPREPDNTGRNARDADGATLTPEDQPNAEQDLELARRIREAVTSNESMSTNAQNVKIIAQGGVVTLRGPVKSEQEKLAIQSIAQQTPGVSRVDNQLEVDPDVEVETEFESEYEEER